MSVSAIVGTALVSICMAAAATVQSASRITRIEFSPGPYEDGRIVISIIGSGECTYTIDYGDGTTERRSVTLPDRLEHGYGADREYMVVATPTAPCEGVARARLDIRAIKQGIWRLSVEAGPATDAAEVIVNVEGRGTCRVQLDLGDGTRQTLEGALPARLSHTYAKPGTYELHAVAEDPCRGDVRLQIDLRRP